MGILVLRQEVSVVSSAFSGAAEGGVGFAYLDEALGGAWVGGVEVWVVGFGEGVELPFCTGAWLAGVEGVGLVGWGGTFLFRLRWLWGRGRGLRSGLACRCHRCGGRCSGSCVAGRSGREGWVDADVFALFAGQGMIVQSCLGAFIGALVK